LTAVDPLDPDAEDLAALALLDAAVSDGGRVTFVVDHLLPPREYLRTMRQNSLGVIARDSSGHPVGSAWVRFGDFRWAGQPARFALLSSLQVHPDARRRGVARALTDWRLQRAGEAIPLATIQAGNVASLANARRWATVIGEPLVVTPVPVRRRPPARRHPWTVREATDRDLDVVIAGLDRQYDDFAMAPTDLRGWLGRPFNSYYVLAGRHDRPLAGVGLHHEARHSRTLVRGLTPAMRWAGRLAGVVPGDGVMRNVAAMWPWHADGAENVGRLLWRQLLHWERAEGTAVVTTLDPRHPAGAMLAAPRWLPRTTISVVARVPAGRRAPSGPLELPG
jgi:GNAT superfamily N-acetyltransferase